jgi:hypothetical protein
VSSPVKVFGFTRLPSMTKGYIVEKILSLISKWSVFIDVKVVASMIVSGVIDIIVIFEVAI